MSRECTNEAKPREGGRGPMKCFKCQEEGHMSRECPNAEGQSRPPRDNGDRPPRDNADRPPRDNGDRPPPRKEAPKPQEPADDIDY